jgi:bifunctional non-homologous end joining protein LigD
MMAIGCASNAMAIACRLIARNGYDWTKRYPWIIEAAPKNRQKQFVIDGEAVILGVDGIPISTRCTRASTITKCSSIYGFDILPLSLRKTNLARLLARRPDGIFVAPFEQGEIGPDLFRAASNMGLEGLVSRRRDRPYRAGR